jgi:hypothetical protein
MVVSLPQFASFDATGHNDALMMNYIRGTCQAGLVGGEI